MIDVRLGEKGGSTRIDLGLARLRSQNEVTLPEEISIPLVSFSCSANTNNEPLEKPTKRTSCLAVEMEGVHEV